MKNHLTRQRVYIDITKLSFKMKITGLLILISLFHVHANVFSQNEKISLILKNTSIETIIEKIEETTDYKFFYNTSNVVLSKKVSINVNKATIKKVLNQILKNSEISYNIIDKQIILRAIKRKQGHSNILEKIDTPEETMPQQLVSGKVYDKEGIPLSDVSVIIKGTNQGVVTNFDGYYELMASKGDTLVYNYIGYIETEILVDNIYTIDVELIEFTFALEGVELVYTGYQEISKERATGSFSNVKEKTLNQKTSQNILSKLNGEISGVFLSPEGGSEEIIIRGLSSINANTSPLIVVDGFPIEGSINNLNPIDIESVTVLKDAAAASIYGIRATNGVIVIVTKKGNTHTNLSINATINTSYRTKRSLKNNLILSPGSQVDNAIGFYNSGNIFGVEQLPNDNFGLGNYQLLNPAIEVLLLQENGELSSQEAASRLNSLRNTDGRDDYSRLFMRPEMWNQYNIAISGGGAENSYRASITYNRNEGELITSSSNQFIANLTNSFKFNDRLELTTNINSSFTREKLNPTFPEFDFFEGNLEPSTYLSQFYINERIVDNNGNYLPMRYGSNARFSQAGLDAGLLHPWTLNLKEEFDNNDHTAKATEVRLQSALKYSIAHSLTAEVRYQYEQNIGSRSNILNTNRFETRYLMNNFTQFDANNNPINFPIPDGSIADFTESDLRAQVFRIQLNYDDFFNVGEHQLTALAGYEVRKTINELRQTRRYGYDNQSLTFFNPQYNIAFPQFINIDGGKAIPDPSNIRFDENRFLSYYGNLAYTFNHKYTLSASTRMDDTNLFGSSKEFRNVPLYSLGLKWNVKEEGFLEASETVSLFNLRATYGTNGNVDRSTSPFLQARIFNDNNLFFNQTSTISSVPNPQLRLEKTRTVNLGLDLGLFDERVSLTLDLYKKDSEDLLVNRSLNATSGVSTSLLNSGELTNKGIDASLILKLVDNKDFKFMTRGNFSVNDNKITSVDVQDFDAFSFLFGNAPRKGDALRTIYSFNYAGLDRNGRPQFIDTTGEIVDFNTDISDVSALVKNGTLIPKYVGSWTNQINFKSWSLRTLMLAEAGHVFKLDNKYNPTFFSLVAYNGFEERWQNPGDENTTNVPALVGDFTNTFALGYTLYQESDEFVDDASTIRLQEIILGYEFGEKTLKSIGFSSFQISAQVNNLFVWNFNKWDVDPVNQLIPLKPRFNININASF